MESAVKLNRLLLKLVLLCHSDIQERQGKLKLSWGNLREQKVLESEFLWLSKSLQSKISTPVTTMVPLPGYIGFNTNLSFGANRRLKPGLVWNSWSEKFHKMYRKIQVMGIFSSKDLNLAWKRSALLLIFRLPYLIFEFGHFSNKVA